jgi:hypothetical protein
VKKAYPSLSLRASWRDPACLLGVVEAISIHKPPGWFKSMKDIIQPVMLRKWDTVYGLVHFGQCLLLNAVVYILFRLAWTHRELNILSVEGVDLVASKVDRLDSRCGWDAMIVSYSGNLQLALVLYGVPNLMWSAWAQLLVFLSDLDVDWDLIQRNLWFLVPKC